MDVFRITDVGDTAFSVEFGETVDRATNLRVSGLCHAIRAASPAGLVEVVPTFRSVLVSYDPLLTCRARLQTEVEALAAEGRDVLATQGWSWRIPVCYDDDLGPDLEEVGRACGLTRQEVIACHGGAEYFVYMLGFMPGFAYMGGLPDRLRLPRRSTPRLKVPAGSVAMADAYAAVYPWDSPGGWHLLGQTPVVFFDLARPRPSLLAAGDRVRFHAIGRAEFDAARRDSEAVAPARLLAEES